MIPIFRVWHHELGRMMSIKNMWFQEGVVEELELNDTVMNDYITSYPDEVTIMQSTGLKDKNGKEIFEGDIVTDGHTTGDIKNHPTLGFYMVDENGVERWFSDHATIEDFEEDVETAARILEIIGNIYENSELIK